MKIPKEWTFKSSNVAKGFDAHVREQLPWYDLCTHAVVHLARHFIPKGGMCYDIGASTGNIGLAINALLDQRKAQLVSIEESREMVANWHGVGKPIVADAVGYDYAEYDFATLFLLLMFIPIHERKPFMQRLYAKLRIGGAIVIVDKLDSQAGYVGTALRRLALAWKMESGTPAADILAKELSLAGYQRPISTDIFPAPAFQFFLLGEFAGWVIIK
jgi:tRNA (cmo5U34)-methyltransferase